MKCPWCKTNMMLLKQSLDNNMQYPGYSLGRTVHEEWICSKCECIMILDGKGNGTKINYAKFGVE